MNFSLAPIVLFVYNRPNHTRKVLDALAQNKEAKDSLLFVYCDGAKVNATNQTINDINETRNIIRLDDRFKQVTIKEHSENHGLANSIINGVTEVININKKVIVMEDDVLPSEGFLKYMNTALDLYQNEIQVGCIHAWNWDLDIRNCPGSTFFLRGADCWGWATWDRAWNEFNPDGKTLLKMIESRNLEFEFNRRNTYNFIDILKNQIEGKNDSWAIRWHASLFIKKMYCLYPTRPLVRNIGLDNSGTHCGEMQLSQKPVESIEINKIAINEADWFIQAYSELDRKNINVIISQWQRLKTFLSQLRHR